VAGGAVGEAHCVKEELPPPSLLNQVEDERREGGQLLWEQCTDGGVGHSTDIPAQTGT